MTSVEWYVCFFYNSSIRKQWLKQLTYEWMVIVGVEFYETLGR